MANEPQTQPLLKQAETLLQQALSPQNVQQALSRLKDGIAVQIRPQCDGELTCTAPEICKTTLIELRSEVLVSWERTGDLLRVRSCGQITEFNEPMAAAVEQLLLAGMPLATGALGQLDEEQRIALVDHLWREGLIHLR